MHKTIYSVLLFLVSVHYTGGKAVLLEPPSAVIYAFVGETVKFEWNYTVNDKNIDFGHYVSSPIWYYYSHDGNKSVLGVEDGLRDWSWKISYATCPARLLHPTVRISKVSVATLLISNVTKTDSGFYEICLVLRTSPSMSNKVELVITGEAVHFTKVPPGTLFVAKGKTARSEWNYHFNNRSIEFQSESPVWGYIDQGNNWATIATLKKNHGWKVSLNTTTCPPRFLHPTRVSIELPGTLVIKNATMADIGTYACSLRVQWGHRINSMVQLIVTDYPVITSPTLTSMIIREGSELSIPCLSRGLPIPNVTWVKVIQNIEMFMTQGLENATLRIEGINRNQSGMYECHANNNPNEVPVTVKIEVIVIFVEEIVSYTNVTQEKYIAEGMNLSLSCSANDSIHSMNITYIWSYVKGNKSFIKSEGVESAGLRIQNIGRDQKGTYKCQASTKQNNTPVTAIIAITVTVLHKPEIDYCLSSEKKVSSFSGYTTYLRCVASGVPDPNITWYGLDGKKLSVGTTSTPGRIEIPLNTTNSLEYGIYRCRAKNTIGIAWHNVTVRKTCHCITNDIDYRRSKGWNIKHLLFITWMTVTVVSASANAVLLIYILKHQRCKEIPRSTTSESDTDISNEQNHISTTEIQCRSLNEAVDDDNMLRIRPLAYERMDLLYTFPTAVDTTCQTTTYETPSSAKEHAGSKQSSFINRIHYQGISYSVAPEQPGASYEHLNPQSRQAIPSVLQTNRNPTNYQNIELKHYASDYQTLTRTNNCE